MGGRKGWLPAQGTGTAHRAQQQSEGLNFVGQESKVPEVRCCAHDSPKRG